MDISRTETCAAPKLTLRNKVEEISNAATEAYLLADNLHSFLFGPEKVNESDLRSAECFEDELDNIMSKITRASSILRGVADRLGI